MSTIKRFVRANRPGAINFRGNIGNMLSRMTGADVSEKSLLQQAYDLYGQALREAKGNNSGNRQWEINEQFKNDIREWNENGRDSNGWFILGSTGEVLQGLGAIENDIYLTAQKAGDIINDHKNMSPEDLEKIPEIIEDPVLALKAKGRNKDGLNARIVMIGNILTKKGRPIVAILDLKPVENGIRIDDMQKINSAYPRRRALNLIKSSDVLHADKNRTIPLLRTFGLTFASRRLLRYGSIGSIEYDGDVVN